MVAVEAEGPRRTTRVYLVASRVDTPSRTDYFRDYKRSRRRPDSLVMDPLVPAGPVRSHLESLRDAGLGTPTISNASGVSKATIDKIRSGARTRISPETRDRLLGVFPSDCIYVDAEPVRAQVAELLATGRWTGRALGRAVHGPTATAVRLNGARVTRELAERVDALHRNAGLAPAPVRSDALASFVAFVYEAQPWRKDSECRRIVRIDPQNSPFFPSRGEAAGPALAVCARCAVWAECLQAALEHDEVGIWGRSTGQQRRDLKHQGLTVEQVAAAIPEGGDVGDAIARLSAVAS